jgi:hypothetical protein
MAVEDAREVEWPGMLEVSWLLHLEDMHAMSLHDQIVRTTNMIYIVGSDSRQFGQALLY